MKQKEINQVVWILEPKGQDYVINKTPHTITDIKSHDICNDYCDHLVVLSPEGKVKKIPEHRALLIPDERLQTEKQIKKFLSDNGCYCESLNTDKDGTILISISWGDWKHSHIWCDQLMQYLGYQKSSNNQITEQDGSDCYSAIHFFTKSNI